MSLSDERWGAPSFVGDDDDDEDENGGGDGADDEEDRDEHTDHALFTASRLRS